jgi:uncharacterized protein YaaN involved in tellurite resistance
MVKPFVPIPDAPPKPPEKTMPKAVLFDKHPDKDGAELPGLSNWENMMGVEDPKKRKLRNEATNTPNGLFTMADFIQHHNIALNAEKKLDAEVKVLFADKAVSTNESLVSDADRAKYPSLQAADIIRIKTLANTTNIYDRNEVLNFGTEVNKRLNDIVDKILDKARNSQTDGINTRLKDLVDLIGKSDLFATAKKGFWEVMGFGSEKKSIKDSFNEINDQIKTATIDLNAKVQSLMVDLNDFDHLFSSTKDHYEDLSIFIEAGKLKLLELAPDIAAREKDKAATDLFVSQQASDYLRSVKSFEKKVQDLEIVQLHSQQTVHQIRIIQDGNLMLVENVNNVLNVAIPSWKKQFITTFSLAAQKGALDAVNDLDIKLLKQSQAEAASAIEKILQSTQS